MESHIPPPHSRGNKEFWGDMSESCAELLSEIKGAGEGEGGLRECAGSWGGGGRGPWGRESG